MVASLLGRPISGAVCCGVLVLWLVSTGAAADRSKDKGPHAKAKREPAMALIVVNAEHANASLKPLANAVPSAIRLGAEFQKCGYAVRYLAGDKAVAAIKKDATPKDAVREANDGKAMSGKVKEWMAEVAAAKPPLAILVLVGHGVQREGVAYLLGRDDTADSGGVSVDELADASAASQLPLVIVYDACRTILPKAPVPKLNIVDEAGKAVDAPPPSKAAEKGHASQLWEKRDEVVAFKSEGRGGLRPTILYSTRSGETAHDRHDLIGNLATGLRHDAEVKRVLAAAHPELQKATALTLYHWFYYAIASQLRDRELQQAHQIVLGAVPLKHPVAAWVGGKLTAPRELLHAEGLLALSVPRWGQFTSSMDLATGLRITHPVNGTQDAKMAFRAGSLAGDEGYTVIGGRTLVLDVVASHDGPGLPPPVLACEIHASNRPPMTDKPVYLCPDTYVYRFPYYVVMTIRIPVKPVGDRQLNGFGFSYPRDPRTAWPRGSTLTVLDMRLEPAGVVGVPTTEPKPTELMADWLPVNPTIDGSPLLGYTIPGKSQGMSLQPALPKGDPVFSKCGGDLLSPVYVPKRSQLQVVAVNSSPRPVELILDVVNLAEKDGKPIGTSLLGAGVVRLRPGTNTLRLPVTGDRFAHYMSVGTKSDGITLQSVKVVPTAGK